MDPYFSRSGRVNDCGFWKKRKILKNLGLTKSASEVLYEVFLGPLEIFALGKNGKIRPPPKNEGDQCILALKTRI